MFGFEQFHFPAGERDATTADEALSAWTTVTIDVLVRLIQEIVVAQGAHIDLVRRKEVELRLRERVKCSARLDRLAELTRVVR